VAPATDLYAVMGDPIDHSQSPRIHALFAAQTRQALRYSAIRVPLGQLAAAVARFREAGGKGLNITVPLKLAAAELVTERSPRAEAAGAVNTIVIRADGSLYGENTDGTGLLRDLTEHLGIELTGTRVLLLGAGGASRGVLGPLLAQRPATLVIANRTPDRALTLAQLFAEHGPVRASDLKGLRGQRFDLIVNATAAGLAGAVPRLPDEVLAEGGCCYDLMYGNEPTAFMQWARDHGAARAADGLGMLVEQAAESFYIWRRVRPRTRPVRRALRPISP